MNLRTCITGHWHNTSRHRWVSVVRRTPDKQRQIGRRHGQRVRI